MGFLEYAESIEDILVDSVVRFYIKTKNKSVALCVFVESFITCKIYA